jgi:hypothetical protein
MQKLLQLEKGSIFAQKGGALVYLSNEQLNKVGRVLNRDTNQIENKYDLDMQKLKIQEPIEKNLSAGFALALEETFSGGVADAAVAEKPAKKAHKKAVKKEDAPATETK